MPWIRGGDAVVIPASGPPSVLLTDVTAGYRGSTVLADVDLRIERGEFVGMVGPSGSGKTTVLRLLTGQVEPYGGRVQVSGAAVRPGRSLRQVGYVPQLEGIDFDFPLTVAQTVLLGLSADSRRLPWFSRAERAEAAALLERLGLAGLADRHIRELSGGQQQRMFLARAMIRRCDLVLLDEPTSGVDLKTRHDVLHLLGELNSEGMTIVLTTHDLNWVATHLPRVVCLNGRVIADGTPAEVFTADVLKQAYGADVRVITDGDMVFVADETHLLPRPRLVEQPTGTDGLRR